MSVRPIYDIVIIGAGPAGLGAGLGLESEAKRCSILLVDRCRPWERRIACAEAVGRLGFQEAVEVNPAWIRFTVSSACFHSPDGSMVEYADPNKGYIIDRARMQKDMVEQCRAGGVECRFGRRVISVGRPKDGVRTIGLSDGGELGARVVIDASGPLSRFGWGEEIARKSFDLEPGYFAVVAPVTCATDTVHIHVGRDIAPGGYAWVFPRTEDSVNVGVLVGSKHRQGANIKKLLQRFVKQTYPRGTVQQRFAGPIPCGCGPRTIALNRLLKAGDAASTINPISRAGIVEALLSGKLAGKAAGRILAAKNDGRKASQACKDYEREWLRARGNRHTKLARVKDSLARVPDEDYNTAARSLADIPQSELTMSRIFKVSLARFPRLVWALRHLM